MIWYFLFFANNSSCLPESTISPSSKRYIQSALIMDEILWLVTIKVFLSLFKFVNIFSSSFKSKLLVASSSKITSLSL